MNTVNKNSEATKVTNNEALDNHIKTVDGYIERKSMLYPTKVEYAMADNVWCMNYVLGCSHMCGGTEKPWCYAYMIKRRTGEVKTAEEWACPKIVGNTMELLSKELSRKKDKISAVFLCFTTDPFMYGYPEIVHLSLEVIKLINSYGIKCIVLTKGVLPVEELAKLSPDNEFGITLVSTSEDYRQMYEPGAAPIQERMEALSELKSRGFKTWVSMEPYPTPNVFEQDLIALLNSASAIADKIIFGRTNYNRLVSSYPRCKDFYNKCAFHVMNFCEARGIAYHIKDGTITG